MLRRLLFLNFRLVYTISNWGRHRLTPMGLLVLGGLVSAGIFGVDIRQSMAYQVFSLCFALLLTSILASLFLRGQFKVRRELPEYATANQKLRYQVLVENLRHKTEKDLFLFDELLAQLPDFDEFRDSRDPLDSSRNRFDRIVGYPRLMGLVRKKRGGVVEPSTISRIDGNQSTRISMELLPVRRGYLNFTGGKIGKCDPLGLVRRLKRYSEADRLLVLPRTYRVPQVQMQGERKYQRGGMNKASNVGDSEEFMSLRDYRPGDPLRDIHWRSYAKTGIPIVKEFQDEFFVRQGLLLDTFIENKSTDVFEGAVSLAASFCMTLPGEDALLDLMFVGDQAYRFTSGRGLGQVENMLEILACTQACYKDTMGDLKTLVSQHGRESSGMICILLDWNKERRDIVKTVSGLGMPHLVFVIVEPQEVEQLNSHTDVVNNQHIHVLTHEDLQSQLDELGNLVISKA